MRDVWLSLLVIFVVIFCNTAVMTDRINRLDKKYSCCIRQIAELENEISRLMRER